MQTQDNAQSYSITMGTLFTCMQEIMPFMRDKKVFEVYINPDRKVWIDTLGKGRVNTGIELPASQTKQIILNVAALTEQLVTADRPYIDAEIPGNEFFPKCRFEGNLPHIVSNPTINIRKHPETVFTLDQYVEFGILTKKQKSIILNAIHQKKNIVAAGGTKSGKTTFLNALLAEISKMSDRVIMIEDTPELQCTAADCVAMQTTPTCSMEDLLRRILRMTPDRIVVGEVRGAEALALLDAWSTGHGGGCSTVHSNSAIDTLLRLENMTARVSKNPQQATIAAAIDYIVYLKYTGITRKVEQIIALDGFDREKGSYIYHEVA